MLCFYKINIVLYMRPNNTLSVINLSMILLLIKGCWTTAVAMVKNKLKSILSHNNDNIYQYDYLLPLVTLYCLFAKQFNQN